MLPGYPEVRMRCDVVYKNNIAPNESKDPYLIKPIEKDGFFDFAAYGRFDQNNILLRSCIAKQPFTLHIFYILNRLFIEFQRAAGKTPLRIRDDWTRFLFFYIFVQHFCDSPFCIHRFCVADTDTCVFGTYL